MKDRESWTIDGLSHNVDIPSTLRTWRDYKSKSLGPIWDRGFSVCHPERSEVSDWNRYLQVLLT